MQLGSRYNQHSFAQLPSANIPRSFFDRSFTVKDTMEFDYLNPFFVDEIVPGDTVNLNVNAFIRLATQKVPILDNLYVDFYFFYCPTRLLWTNFKKFMGEQDNPGDSISYTVPQMVIPAGGPEVGALADKFGLPTDVAAGYQVNSLPFRMYNLLWNQWFRHIDLQNSVTVDLDDGTDALADYVLLKAGKKHDYFTTCLPAPQKGTAVGISLAGTAPILSDTSYPNYQKVRKSSDGTLATNTNTLHGMITTGYLGESSNTTDYYIDPNGTLYADLASATAISINDFRYAIQVQSLLELMARGGTRYTDIVLSHFGVVITDARLQRVEFLGGGTIRINSHPVAQTAITSGSNALAQLGAFGTASTAGQRIGFSKSFTEHGYIMGLCSARADQSYMQGVNRMWLRSSRYDFYWPKLQALGEQSVTKMEIYTQGTGDDSTVFGYQERFAEMKYRPSEIHGKFKSQYATPIDQWHMAEEFGSLPSLNSTFIVRNTPIDRAIAVTGEPALLFDSWIDYKHARPMQTHSIPAGLTRF